MSYGYIYLIKDHFTNKVYIGQKKGLVEKTEWYYGSGKIIQNIARKRKHHLSKIILGYCESIEELDYAEKECIVFYNSTNNLYGYNLTNGGCGTNGCRLTQHHKQRIANSNRKRKISNITKLKISKSNSGKKRSIEFKENRRKICTGRFYSKETRDKIGEAHKGMQHSKESKQQISDNRKGKCTGKNNSMFGVSMIQRLINKYGEEEGKIRYEQWKLNKKKRMSI